MARKPAKPTKPLKVPVVPGLKQLPGKVPGRPGISVANVRKSVMKTIVKDMVTYRTALVAEAGGALDRMVKLSKNGRSEATKFAANKDLMDRAFGTARPMAPSEDEAPSVIEIRVKGGLPSEEERIRLRNASSEPETDLPAPPKEPHD